jgi:hypothetical protein
MADIERVKAKVQEILSQEFSGVTLERSGEFSLRYGSSRAFVRVWSHDGGDATFVAINIPLLFDVKETPELFQHVALHADDYVFGHLSLYRSDAGDLRVFFTHTLLGDYLDSEELSHALGGMLGTADRLDDELQQQYGGTKFHEQE